MRVEVVEDGAIGSGGVGHTASIGPVGARVTLPTGTPQKSSGPARPNRWVNMVQTQRSHAFTRTWTAVWVLGLALQLGLGFRITAEPNASSSHGQERVESLADSLRRTSELFDLLQST